MQRWKDVILTLWSWHYDSNAQKNTGREIENRKRTDLISIGIQLAYRTIMLRASSNVCWPVSFMSPLNAGERIGGPQCPPKVRPLVGRKPAGEPPSLPGPLLRKTRKREIWYFSWLKRISFAFVRLLPNFSRKSGAKTDGVFAMLLPLFRRDPGAPAQSRVQVSVP